MVYYGIMNKIYLLTAKAPQNISLQIEKFRSLIFKRTGCVSARVFDAIIPLAFLDKPVGKTVFSSLVKEEVYFKSEGLTEHKKTWYLQVFPEIFFNKLRMSKETENSSPLFQPVTGFFLAVNEKNINLKQILQLWDESNHGINKKWHNISLSLLAIDYEETDFWWKAVTWTVLWNLKIKKTLHPTNIK